MYKVTEFHDDALWGVYFEFSDSARSAWVTAYKSVTKAEVTANFLNLLDQVEDDDTEQLNEINRSLGF